MRAARQAGTLYEDWPKFISGRGPTYAWCYELVSNWRGGLDVDRLDYFLRDAHHLYMSCPCEWQRWVSNLRVLYDRCVSPPSTHCHSSLMASKDGRQRTDEWGTC